MKNIYIILFLSCFALQGLAQVAVDVKGTKFVVDSSKWKLSGANIFLKNTGNTGIGTSAPAYKLDIHAAANPLRLMGVQNGNAGTDSILTIQNGVIKKINGSSFNGIDSTAANNGLTLNGKTVQLGGNLTQASTITSNSNTLTFATGGTALNITGLTAGATTDSLVSINTTTGRINRINPALLNKNDSTTASNGLTLSGKNILLGGNLTQASTITSNSNTLTFATGGTALNITGLTAGATTDSVVTINTTTGRINRINPALLNKSDSTTASNGLTLSGKDILLGGNLTQASTITSNSNTLTFATGGTALNITGLTAGATTDSLVSINTTTGRINRINPALLNKSDSTTASNGLTLSGKNILLGGNLTQASTITSNSNTLTFATGGTALNITGLTAGAATDSLVTINPSTGRINRIAPDVFTRNDSTTASNGLTLSGKNILLGGNLTQSSTITSNSNTLTFATGGTALNITGLTAGATTDSVVTINPTTGRINRISPALLNKSDSTTASNGLTLSGKNILLGGNLTQASTITSNSNTLTFATGGTALNITGLTAGAATDSLMSINPATGKINRITPALLNKNDSTTASNGLTLSGKDILLGGNLTQASTITSNSNTLTFATGGTALNITGLTAGATTDSLITINSTTGRINRITPALLNKNDSTTASNGLTLSGNDIQLGGSLSQATSISTSASNTLSLLGVQSGTSTDSILVLGSGSVLKKVAQVAFPQLLVEAKRTTAYTPTSTYDTVVYNSASTNVGSAYSTTNGVFTAPATGLYEIIFNNSYALTSSSSTVVTMYASNQVRANGSVDMEKTSGAYKNANGIVVNATLSGNTMVSLTSGQTVYIAAAGISSSGATAPALYGSGQHVLKIIRHQ